MPTAIVTKSNGKVTQVQLVPAEGTEDTVVDAEVLATTSAAEGETTAEVKSPPNPISIAPNELAWTAGSFFVLLIVMRYYLFPKLKNATNARYDSIRADIEGADEVPWLNMKLLAQQFSPKQPLASMLHVKHSITSAQRSWLK